MRVQAARMAGEGRGWGIGGPDWRNWQALPCHASSPRPAFVSLVLGPGPPSLQNRPRTTPHAGYLFTFYNAKKTDERKAQIQRINDQVRLLYGPLLACVYASRAAYAAMVRQHSPDGTLEGFLAAMRLDPKGKEAAAYRHWMKDVMQPLNERAADIIVDHVNLLESPDIDPRLLQLVAHVSAYKVIITRWDRGAVGEWSAISYPNTVRAPVSGRGAKVGGGTGCGRKGDREGAAHHAHVQCRSRTNAREHDRATHFQHPPHSCWTRCEQSSSGSSGGRPTCWA